MASSTVDCSFVIKDEELGTSKRGVTIIVKTDRIRHTLNDTQHCMIKCRVIQATVALDLLKVRIVMKN